MPSACTRLCRTGEIDVVIGWAPDAGKATRLPAAPPPASMARRVRLGTTSFLSSTTAFPRSFPRLLRQELADRRRDFFGMCFEREMPGVEECHDRAGGVALERFGARRQGGG